MVFLAVFQYFAQVGIRVWAIRAILQAFAGVGRDVRLKVGLLNSPVGHRTLQKSNLQTVIAARNQFRAAVTVPRQCQIFYVKQVSIYMKIVAILYNILL
ncbi:hypothetical protein CY34DRAFT_800840 [Suillus luteus UH-Slu-Lm8-n1]|uniref:Uncharacterized protein n=1 Tax=Suillus luteus UH-Slu-Lm8-n1 TaxID=930992 RepID=A0A0D0B8J4_9AGAM|nr:hypothetical protein CY34DRAFT_800840 [Suillus luteus UH-Slu-Lm8-n1]